MISIFVGGTEEPVLRFGVIRRVLGCARGRVHRPRGCVRGGLAVCPTAAAELLLSHLGLRGRARAVR